MHDYKIKVYDPVVSWSSVWHSNCEVVGNALEAISDTDVLVIMTPWEEFRGINLNLILAKNKLKIIIDPYGVLNRLHIKNNQLRYFTLGKKENHPNN